MITKILAKIAKSKNCCVIHSSHDLDVSIPHVDEILIIDPICKSLSSHSNLKTNKEEIIKLAFPNVQPSNT